MEKGLIFALKSRFDNIAHVDEESGIEFWYARELQKELGYQRWENFMIAIERAETACVNSKIECHNHFREVTKMVTIGSSAERGIIDINVVYSEQNNMYGGIFVSVPSFTKGFG